MQLKTILNRVQKFKLFVYIKVRWASGGDTPELEVEVAERANGRAICSGCGCPRPGYDRLPVRRFEFVPLWGIKVFLLYAPRRVDCPACGVRVEAMPWASGKSPLTRAYVWFLARWARRLSCGRRWRRYFAPPGRACSARWRWRSSGAVPTRISGAFKPLASTRSPGRRVSGT